MAVKMRLKRMGQKKSPFYRVVVADSNISERWKIHRRNRYLRSESGSKCDQIRRRRCKKMVISGSTADRYCCKIT